MDNIEITVQYTTDCVLTQYFSEYLNGIWSPYNVQSDGRTVYSMFSADYSLTLYLYWNNTHSLWTIDHEFGVANDGISWLYICSEYDLRDCTAGKWRYSGALMEMQNDTFLTLYINLFCLCLGNITYIASI